jgi:hypothetical protein
MKNKVPRTLSRENSIKLYNSLKDGTYKPSFIHFKNDNTDKILMDIIERARYVQLRQATKNEE